MGRWEKESFEGVIIKSDAPGEEEGKILCADCFEKVEEKQEILDVITREMIEDNLFVCDECGYEI